MISSLAPVRSPALFVKTISPVVSRYFPLVQSLCFLAYGVKEILYDGFYQERKLAKVQLGDAGSVFQRVKVKAAQVFKKHGALYVGSAVASTGIALHGLNLINLAPALPFLQIATNGLFLYACIVSLEHFVTLYRQAEAMSAPEELARASRLKYSSILGILNSLVYIAAILTLAASSSIALILVGIGLTTGCLKILYDYFYAY